MHHPHRILKTKPGSLEEAILHIVSGKSLSEAVEVPEKLDRMRYKAFDILVKIASITKEAYGDNRHLGDSTMDKKAYMRWESGIKKIEGLLKEIKPLMMALKKEIK